MAAGEAKLYLDVGFGASMSAGAEGFMNDFTFTRIDRTSRLGAALAIFLGAALFFVALPAGAHCDTEDGPVVTQAKAALEKGDVTLVLKWVKPESEPALRAAFVRASAARKEGAQARALADDYFIETLVRIHREGEGAPYTGIKPAGTPIEPGIALADLALEKGSVDELVQKMSRHIEEGIRERFAHASRAKKTSESSVEKGREFVAAYVELMHYVERLHVAATTNAAHGHEPSAERHEPAAHAH